MPSIASYSIVKFVPDPVRQESVNIGLVFAAGSHVEVRVVTSFSRLKKLYPTVDVKRLERIKDKWEDWIAGLIYEQEGNTHAVLKGLSNKLIRQTQLSEPLHIEVDADHFDSEQVRMAIDELFERFVATPEYAAVKRPKKKTRISTSLNRDFRKYGLLNKVVYEGHWIDGTTPHPVTYMYENGRTVALETLDLHFHTDKVNRARLIDATFGKWTDIEKFHGPSVEKVSILHEIKGNDFDRYIDYLKSVSRVFVVPNQHEEVVQKVLSDLPEHISPELRGTFGRGSSSSSIIG